MATPKQQGSRLRDAIAIAVQRLIDEEPDGGQKRVAERLGVGQSAVSEMLARKREPRLDTLVVLREELGMSLDEILQLPPVAPAASTEDARVALVLTLARELNVPLPSAAPAPSAAPPDGKGVGGLKGVERRMRRPEAPENRPARSRRR